MAQAHGFQTRGRRGADQPILPAQCLQLAIARRPFAFAWQGMVGQQQGGEHAPLFFDALTTGLDLHSCFALANAGRGQDTTGGMTEPKHPVRRDRRLSDATADAVGSKVLATHWIGDLDKGRHCTGWGTPAYRTR